MAKTQTNIERQILVVNVCAAYMRIYERHAIKPNLSMLIKQYGQKTFAQKEALQIAIDDMLARRRNARTMRSRNLDMKESINPVLEFMDLPILK